jgi:methylphosphotriester-DNA--protein-cysteine methyltransferase
VLGTRVDEVVERAASATAWTDRFAIVRTWVDHADSAAFGDAEVEHAWRLLSESRGTVSVKQLCDATGWSANRLRRRFERQVGMPPKRAARLIRFDCARRLLVAGMSSADTAAHAGFADQSHLHREVGRSLT